ncbi:SDR family NAD(P)-dependent oxidoreductase [Bacillus velezensis]|uniref:SDR family NAD(P)-dependent oxidoreductase n=1 Tax=Bacillus velezensis TaxID=492670 RepID=UPI003974DB7E
MKQTALVTGASGGIGQSISEVLAKNGYDVLLHYHSNKEAANRLAERLSASFGVKASAIQADLSSPDGAETLSRSVKQPVDALILNSGKSHFGLITDVTDDTAREMVQLHVTSPFLLARNLVPGMIRKKCGALSRSVPSGEKQVHRARYYTAWSKERSIRSSKRLPKSSLRAASA